MEDNADLRLALEFNSKQREIILRHIGKDEAERQTQHYTGAKIGNLLVYFDGFAAEGVEMPPQPYFKDGGFRQHYNQLEYRFMHNGEQLSVCGIDHEECYKKRLDVMTGKRVAANVQTLGQWLEEWHKLYDNKSLSGNNIKQNGIYIEEIIKGIGHLPLTKITGLDIQRFLMTYEDRKNTQEKISKKIKSALVMALNVGKIKVNPCMGVSLKKHIPKKNRSLTFKEQRLMDKNIDKPYYNLYNFCCCTGLRISEALSIRKKDIDFKAGMIYAERKKKRGKTVIAPIPFLPELINFNFTDNLFDIKYAAFDSYIERLYERLKIENAKIHTFRHTFASNCNKAGINDKKIQEMLCHEELKTTQDTYMHLIEDEGTSPQYEYILRLKTKFNL